MSDDPYRWDKRVEAWEKVAGSGTFLAIRNRIVELAEPRSEFSKRVAALAKDVAPPVTAKPKRKRVMTLARA